MLVSGPLNLRPDTRSSFTVSRETLLLGGIIAAAALVRFGTLGHQSYDHDEAVTAWRVLSGGPGKTLHEIIDLERSPPLYYLLAWPWAQLFGTGEIGLRSLSALVGVLTVPAAYLAGRKLASPRAGLIAAALVAFNPYLVWYSQEARSYALVVLFVAWGLYFFACCLDDPSPRNLALWAAASGLALCSHYFAVFPVGAEGLWLAVRGWPRRAPIVAFAATVAVGLALVPLAITQQGTGRTSFFSGHPLLIRASRMLVSYLASVEPGGFSAGSPAIRYFRGGVVAVAGILLTAVALALLLRRTTRRELTGGLTVAGVAVIALIVPFGLATVGLDFVDERNMIAALVPLLIAAAIGFGANRARRLGLVCAVAAISCFVAVLGAVYASDQMQRPNWRGAAAAMGPPSGKRVLVVPPNGQEPIAYFRNGKVPRFRSARFKEIDALSTLPTISPPGHGFRLIEKRSIASCCTLWRYRARRPTLVHLAEVRGSHVLHERSKVLVEGFG